MIDDELFEYLKEQNPEAVEKFYLENELKTDFYKFVKYFWDDVVSNEMVDNWHIEYVCDEIRDLSEDLKINLPTGETTTTLLSIMLPAFNLANDKSTLVVTKNSGRIDLANVKKLVTCSRYTSLFGNVEVYMNGNVVHSNNSYIKVSILSSGNTGLHFDCIVCDNILSNDANAKEIEETLERFEQLYSRKKSSVDSVLIVAESGYVLTDEIDFINKQICLPSVRNNRIKPECMKHAYTNGLMNEKRCTNDFLSSLEELVFNKFFSFEGNTKK